MRTSEGIQKISAALAKALPAIQNATKDSTNPHFRSDYASLKAVQETTKPVLAEHGIVAIQGPGWDGEHCTLTTRFLHESGEWIETVAGTPVSKADPQGIGSAITYLRRYALAAMAGITQEDDDGNSASGPASRPAQKANASSGDMIDCPACAGPMWDNREGKTNPKQPDLKCKDKACDHAIWLKSWRDDVIKLLVDLHTDSIIDAAERDKAEKAVASLEPAKMKTVHEWVEKKIQEGVIGAGA